MTNRTRTSILKYLSLLGLKIFVFSKQTLTASSRPARPVIGLTWTGKQNIFMFYIEILLSNYHWRKEWIVFLHTSCNDFNEILILRSEIFSVWEVKYFQCRAESGLACRAGRVPASLCSLSQSVWTQPRWEKDGVGLQPAAALAVKIFWWKYFKCRYIFDKWGEKS